MSKLVSILIPCHNAAPYLAQTLDSALAQTHRETEIIVVDDGSTDGSAEIVERYGPAVRLIRGPARGASHARNLATEASTGSWIQYLDADDLLLPAAVESRLQAASEGAGAVCGDWRRIARTAAGEWAEEPVQSGDFRSFAEEPDLAVLRGFWLPPAAILYERTLVRRIGGWHPDLPVIQDARFLFDAATRGAQFVHVAGNSAHYRQHAAGSLSSRSAPRFWRDVLRNNREIEGVLAASGRLDPERRRALAQSYALGARVSLLFDRDLFRENVCELARFPDFRPSKYLRLALLLDRTAGYGFARAVMRIAGSQR